MDGEKRRFGLGANAGQQKQLLSISIEFSPRVQSRDKPLDVRRWDDVREGSCETHVCGASQDSRNHNKSDSADKLE